MFLKSIKKCWNFKTENMNAKISGPNNIVYDRITFINGCNNQISTKIVEIWINKKHIHSRIWLSSTCPFSSFYLQKSKGGAEVTLSFSEKSYVQSHTSKSKNLFKPKKTFLLIFRSETLLGIQEFFFFWKSLHKCRCYWNFQLWNYMKIEIFIISLV